MIKDNFQEAKEFFQTFLSAQGLSSDLLWVFGEDVISLENRFVIKVPLPRENESYAEDYYDIGRKRDFGLGLTAFCLLDGRPCCYIQLPEDDLDAQYSLMGNHAVKYTISCDLLNAETTNGFLAWQIYRLSEKFLEQRFRLDKLPFRKARRLT